MGTVWFSKNLHFTKHTRWFFFILDLNNTLEILFYENTSMFFSLLLIWSEVKSLSRVRLFATPWTVTYQASLSMGFSRQEYWSGLPFPSPGVPNHGLNQRPSRCYVPVRKNTGIQVPLGWSMSDSTYPYSDNPLETSCLPAWPLCRVKGPGSQKGHTFAQKSYTEC